MKTDPFWSCGHCWGFQICWHSECSTLTALSFRIWHSLAGIPSPPLALFVMMLPKAHLTSHSRMSASRWVITPSWLSGSLRSFLYSSSVYCCYLFLISSASVRSIPFLSFTVPHKRLSQTCLWVPRSLWQRCGLTMACSGAGNTEYNSPGISLFEGGHYYCHYPPGQTIGREHRLTYQQEIGLKIYWAWPCPSEQDSDSPTASPSHQKASTSLLSLPIRRQTEWKPQLQKTNQIILGSQPFLTQWNYEPCRVGPPKMHGSW